MSESMEIVLKKPRAAAFAALANIEQLTDQVEAAR